ncbi:MAG: anion transporter [Bryobacteraceae bacterium]|nr:anion transporter [Bryobacteraceae bacterium]
MALGRLPYFHVDRTGAAIIGGALMIGVGVLTADEAYRSVDYPTLALLLGMMIVVANLRLSGFFALVARYTVEHAHRPLLLLSAVTGIAGVFSAFFVNDTMCLVLTPLVIEVTASAGLNPLPFLLAVAMGSNIGSATTITGNPQNMMIGSFSGIPYWRFAAALAPSAAIGLVLAVAVIAAVYRRELRAGKRMNIAHRPVRTNKVLMWKSLVVSAGMIASFFIGWPVSQVALVSGALLLVTRRVKPEEVYHEIDWQLLVLFAGLFIVVDGLDKVAIREGWLADVGNLPLSIDTALAGVTAALSNIIGNVPAVLMLKPLLTRVSDAQHAWLVVAMSSTFAGNMTLVGSVANIIVVQRARREGIHIGFGDYLKAGLPLGLATIAAGLLLLRITRP